MFVIELKRFDNIQLSDFLSKTILEVDSLPEWFNDDSALFVFDIQLNSQKHTVALQLGSQETLWVGNENGVLVRYDLTLKSSSLKVTLTRLSSLDVGGGTVSGTIGLVAFIYKLAWDPLPTN